MSTRTLEVRTKEGNLRLEIDEGWKVTFGPLSMKGYAEGNALRIYEAKDKQRACFVNVISFRDLSIPVEREVKAVRERTRASSDGKGNTDESRNVETDPHWEKL